MTWRREHGEQYEVPGLIQYLVRRRVLEDSSWHNDVAPSFRLVDPANEEYGITLWVDHPVKSMRETGGKRFVVVEGELISEREFELETDDLEEALETFFDRAFGPRFREHPLMRMDETDPGNEGGTLEAFVHSWLRLPPPEPGPPGQPEEWTPRRR